jgi:hypothetical protein
MSGKNPLGLSKEPQAYEGINVIVPIGGWNFVKAKIDPTTSAKKNPVGTLWLNTVLQNLWVQTQPGNWVLLSSGGSDIVAIVSGSATQITAVTNAGITTLTIPATFIAPGSITSITTLTGGTGITATTGNIVASAGNITTTLGSITSATTLTATSGAITATNGNFVGTAVGTGILLNSAQASGIAANPVVVNGRSGRATFTTVSIAAGADLTLTLTNSAITASTTEVMLSMSGATSGSALSIKSKTASAGSLAIVVTNGTGATTTVADIQIDFLVLNA